MAVLSRDFVQLIDNKGDPIVGATIYIGEGNRDPQLFPRLAYSNQARTNVLGSELISNDSGLIPKAYIEPPFSYRIRLRDGSQYEESLFSFGIVEIDYTPDGLGVDAINVGGRYQQVILEQDAISQSVQDLFGRVGVNTDNLAQEILNRTESIANETQLRVDAIQAAIDAAAAGDSTLKADLDQKFASVAASAESAQATANAGVSSSESALTLISESSEDIQALTLRADSSESEIQSNGSQILSVSEKTTATESRINDVFGDGSSFSLESFAADTSLTKAAIENSTTGLSATRDKVINTEARLNDVAGDASGKTVEQLAADYESLDSDVSQSAQASVEGFNQVNVRFGLIEDSLESTASQLNTVQAQANTANTTANAAFSSAQAANITANSASGEVSAIVSDLREVEVNVNGIKNSVTQQTTAINSIEGGVVNQWEVKSTIGDISGAIGLYNDGGSTKVAIDANAFEIWDTATNDTVPAFDLSGGQLSINVPTFIEELSIGTNLIADNALSSSARYSSAQEYDVPTRADGFDNTTDRQIINGLGGLTLVTGDTESAQGESVIDYKISFRNFVNVVEVNATLNAIHTDLSTILVVEAVINGPFSSEPVIEVMRAPISAVLREFGQLKQNQSQLLVSIADSFTIDSRVSQISIRARVTGFSAPRSPATADSYDKNVVGDVRASVTVIKK